MNSANTSNALSLLPTTAMYIHYLTREFASRGGLRPPPANNLSKQYKVF